MSVQAKEGASCAGSYVPRGLGGEASFGPGRAFLMLPEEEQREGSSARGHPWSRRALPGPEVPTKTGS